MLRGQNERLPTHMGIIAEYMCFIWFYLLLLNECWREQTLVLHLEIVGSMVSCIDTSDSVGSRLFLCFRVMILLCT